MIICRSIWLVRQLLLTKVSSGKWASPADNIHSSKRMILGSIANIMIEGFNLDIKNLL